MNPLVRLLYPLSVWILLIALEPPTQPWTFARPSHLPLLGQIHALAVHIPAMWSDRVLQRHSVILTEHIIYHGLLHVAALEMLWQNLSHPSAMAWIVAVYCALYYSWDIAQCARTLRNCTLSATALLLSMLLFAGGTVPYVWWLAATPPPPHLHILEGHCGGWLVADLVDYSMQAWLYPRLHTFV